MSEVLNSEKDDAYYATLQKQLDVAKRLAAYKTAKDSLLEYIKLQMPDPESADPLATRYQVTPQARLLCEIIEKVERGEPIEKGKRTGRVAVSIGPQMGKALEVDTPIPTPDGWKAIGALRPGDFVFDDQGSPTEVVAVSPVWRDRELFVVESDDRGSVFADAEHEWNVRLAKSWPVSVKPKTTGWLYDRKAQRAPMIPAAGALSLPDADLPIDPWVLGFWLGDGTSGCGAVTVCGQDQPWVLAEIGCAGFRVSAQAQPMQFGVLGLNKPLRLAGLIKNKHIPPAYLRASARQRLALLQGLIDSDGYVDANGAVDFTTTNARLAEDFQELVWSLGVKVFRYDLRATLNGRDCGPKYRFSFFMKEAARMPRKAVRCRSAKKTGRYIKVSRARRKGDTVCIQVAAASSMFLCGKAMIPTHNSEIITRGAPAWISGRNPTRNTIVGTYNQTFAEEFGEQVRHRIQSPIHQAVFPKHRLRKGAVNLLVTEEEGRTAFVGVGGSGSGKPADFFIVDDPYRNDEDANSETYRDTVWKWFNGVVFARAKKRTAIIVVHTRWNADDLIGRLCDPDHPERNKDYAGIADNWTYINIPAVIEDPTLASALGLTPVVQKNPYVVKAFGTKPMVALWEDEKPLELLAEAKIMDPRTFGALYMGKPTPDEGEFFKRDWLVEYQPHDLPEKLRKFGASDHAVSVKQSRDYSVIGCVGIDEREDIWVLPDITWDRMETDRAVEELLYHFKEHKPQLWWMENENIAKSFGPFLKKRMVETRNYVTLDPIVASKDKRTRARAIQGRMSMRKVHFPAFASWWPEARAQILQFDHGANDDFVDWLSLIGQGLMKEYRPSSDMPVNDNVVRVGSMQWILKQSALRVRREKRRAAGKGW